MTRTISVNNQSFAETPAAIAEMIRRP